MTKMPIAATLYVSETFGDDHNSGLRSMPDETKNGPVKTLEKALEIVASIRAQKLDYPITIKLTDSVYHIKNPIVITEQVSAVTIEPTCKTLITGGIEINNFKRDSFNGVSCLSADLSHLDDLAFTDFYIDGKPAAKTKFPKQGTLTPEAVENDDPAIGARSQWFIAKEEDFKIIKDFQHPEDWIISFNHYWVDEHSPILSIDQKTRKITLRYLSQYTVSSKHPKSAMRYIIENVAETFSNPGEWYYDKVAKKLYYIPESEDIDPKDLTGYIPVTEKLFIFRGTEEKKVQNVTIRNFEIAHTKGDFKSVLSKDYRPLELPPNAEAWASVPQAVCTAPGGIELEHTYGCAIENCHLFCFGLHCLSLQPGVRNTRIVKNRITQIGAGGITVRGGEAGSPETAHTYGNIITDNTVLYCGRRYFAACGMLIRHTYDNTIAHNEIGYTYYTGISCGWVWGYKDSITRNNCIEKNHIHHIGQGKLSDMGGIYLLGKQPGTVVRNNLIHDVKANVYGGFGLYPDEGSSYILFENNICYNTSDAPFHQHYGAMNTVRNNIFLSDYDSPVHYSRREEHIGVILERNIMTTPGQVAYRMGYVNMAEGPGLLENDTGNKQEIVSKNNLIFDTKRPFTKLVSTEKREYSPEETREVFGIDEGSLIADPKFVALENHCFDLSEQSPAHAIGFKPIDMSDVGPR